MGRSELVDVELMLMGETAQAIRVEDADENTVWLPKSQIEIERRPNDRVITVTMPQWLAEEKGLV